MSDINSLQQSLQQLESELSKFRSAKQILDDARSRTETDLKNWKERQDISEQRIIQLVDSLSKSNDAALKLVENVSPLAERMIGLAKTVENAGFPRRLDLIQSNITNVMTAAQGLQSRIDLLEMNQGNAIKVVATELKSDVDKSRSELLAAVHSESEGIKALAAKNMKWIIGLLSITLLTIISLAIVYVKRG